MRVLCFTDPHFHPHDPPGNSLGDAPSQSTLKVHPEIDPEMRPQKTPIPSLVDLCPARKLSLGPNQKINANCSTSHSWPFSFLFFGRPIGCCFSQHLPNACIGCPDWSASGTVWLYFLQMLGDFSFLVVSIHFTLCCRLWRDSLVVAHPIMTQRVEV